MVKHITTVLCYRISKYYFIGMVVTAKLCMSLRQCFMHNFAVTHKVKQCQLKENTWDFCFKWVEGFNPFGNVIVAKEI